MTGARTSTDLASTVDLLTGFPFKSSSYCGPDEGVRLVRGDNVMQRGIRWDGAKHWPSSLTGEFGKYRLMSGDVVLAMDRPWIEAGLKVAEIRAGDAPSLLVQRVARLRTRDPGLRQDYLKWLLYTPAFTQHVLSVQTGTAVPHISGGQILSFKFELPDLDEQRRIAGVLGAFDDLIDTNTLLASRAQSLAVALLEGAEEVTALSEVAVPVKATLFRPVGTVEHYSLPAFDACGRPETVDGGEIKSGKQRLVAPSVLVSRLNPQTPRVWMSYPAGEAAASTEFVVLAGKDDVAVEEIWAACSSQTFASEMRSRVTGTTGSHQRVDKAAIPTIEVPDPRSLGTPHRRAVVSLVQEADGSLAQAAELAKIRDELLPLLMSGRITVDEAWEAVPG